MKIALVYDRVNKTGGAERVLEVLHEIWPDAPLYTAVYNKSTAPWADNYDIKTTFLQRLPFAKTRHELLPWVTPFAFSKLDFSSYDVVLSVTSAEAKSVVCSPNTLHICYCLTPTRYLWSHKAMYEQLGLKGSVLKILGPWLRMKDYEASSRVNHFIAISTSVQKRIVKYYRRDSTIVYPPVTLEKSNYTRNGPVLADKPYYLVVSRLVPYKRIEIAIKACNYLKNNLVIIGKGSDEKRLRSLAGPTITFTGQLTDEELNRYYMQCQAVIFPGHEDFGIVPLETQSFGKPVIAYGSGGVMDTVTDARTGVLFYKQTADGLVDAINRFTKLRFDPKVCEDNVIRFSKDRFKQEMELAVTALWKDFVCNY